jgi:hypothetical protein
MIRGEIMINNNLNINLNPTVSLNSINYKSNQHLESFPYELDKIHPKMLQRDGVVMKMMKVLVMMMMIPMKPSSMTMKMATFSPFREGISPADFCLPESFLSMCVFCPAEAAESIFDPPLGLRFSRRRYTRGGNGRGGPGRPHHQVARPRAGPRHQVVWALVAHLALSFWLLPSSNEILICGYFPGIAGLQKYGVLMVLFPAES